MKYYIKIHRSYYNYYLSDSRVGTETQTLGFDETEQGTVRI